VVVLRGGDDRMRLIEGPRLTICAGGGDDELTFSQDAAGHREAGDLLDGGRGRDLVGDVGDVEFLVAGY